MIQQESLKKRLAKLAAPIFIETLLIMMLGAVDTIMPVSYTHLTLPTTPYV